MTTSINTSTLNPVVLRRLVDEANALPLEDRVTLLKGLIPGTAREMSPPAFTALIAELLLKGERLYEAMSHPGQGRVTRVVMGERDLEQR